MPPESCSAGMGREEFFPGFPSVGSGEQRPVNRSPVVYTLLSVLMSFLLIFLTSLLFVCSLLFSSRPVMLNVFVPSFLLSILPRRAELTT